MSVVRVDSAEDDVTLDLNLAPAPGEAWLALREGERRRRVRLEDSQAETISTALNQIWQAIVPLLEDSPDE